MPKISLYTLLFSLFLLSYPAFAEKACTRFYLDKAEEALKNKKDNEKYAKSSLDQAKAAEKAVLKNDAKAQKADRTGDSDTATAYRNYARESREKAQLFRESATMFMYNSGIFSQNAERLQRLAQDCTDAETAPPNY